MAKKNNARVVSFLNDTADQQEKLAELIQIDKSDSSDEDKKIEAKKTLSNWGLIHFKLQALLLGKIVFSDSFLWNNFFLHDLSEEKFESFVSFVTTQKVIEVRCRSDKVPSVFERMPNIRNYWSNELELRMREIREKLGNQHGERIFTASKFFDVIDSVFGSSHFAGIHDFSEFRSKIMRHDKLYAALRSEENTELVVPWCPVRTDRLFFLKRKMLLDRIDSMWGKNVKEFNEKKTRDLKHGAYDFDAVKKFKEYVELLEVVMVNSEETIEYNGATVEKMCDKIGVNEEGKRTASRFFFNDFHKEVFCFGVAQQHECDFMQTREIHRGQNEVKLVIPPNGREQLCNMEWQEFSNRYSHPEFRKMQNELLVLLKDANQSSEVKEIKFKGILKTGFGIDCDRESIETVENKNPDPVSSTSLSDPTKLYIADAEGELKGSISIEIE
jgi:hypothetical protein